MEISREVLRSSIRIRRKKFFQLFSYGCLALSALFALSSLISHQDRLLLKQIFISGNKMVEDSRIFNISKGALVGNYYGIYPRSNVLIYPRDEVATSLLHNIPWIASVSVSASMNMLYVNVIEREPKYLWCDDATKPIMERVCYYLDADGFAFDKAPNFSRNIYLGFFGGNRRGGYVGRSILSSDDLRAILEVKNSADQILRDHGAWLGKIFGVYVHTNGDYDLLLTDGKNEWKILFDLNTDVPKKLRAILASPFFLKEIDSAKGRLEYIDLRFGKKVFYKFSK